MRVRSRILPLLAAATSSLTGCVSGSWATHSDGPPVVARPVPTDSVPPAKTTRFADVLRVPGQQVPLNGPWPVESVVEVTPVTPPPEIAPPISPPNTTPTPDPPLVSALREILAGRSGGEYLRQLDPARYEHLAQLLPAVAQLSRVPPAQLDPKDAAEILRQFDPTLAVVARRAPLRVERAVFCRDVKGYGRYDPLPDRIAFHPNQMYILYFEVGNVPNEPDGRAGAEGFSTRLTCTVQVKDDAGRTVELTDQGKRDSKPLLQNDKVDFSRSPVRDYYAYFWFYAPSKAGRYSVRIEVRDPATAREVSTTLPFEVR
jgi:hypothetical protein